MKLFVPLCEKVGIKLVASGIITGKKVDITVPFGTNLDSQVATFFKIGVKAIVGGTEQKSGETTNNYSNDLIFQISAENGTTSDYTISTKTGTADSKLLQNFQFDSLSAEIAQRLPRKEQLTVCSWDMWEQHITTLNRQ